VLKEGGTFVAKVLRGGTERSLIDRLSATSQKSPHVKPKPVAPTRRKCMSVATGFSRLRRDREREARHPERSEGSHRPGSSEGCMFFHEMLRYAQHDRDRHWSGALPAARFPALSPTGGNPHGTRHVRRIRSVYQRQLGALSKILEKAARGPPPRRSTRRCWRHPADPDMLPLTARSSSPAASPRRSPARLAGIEGQGAGERRENAAELRGRIDAVLAHLKAFKPEQVDGSENREIVQHRRQPAEAHGTSNICCTSPWRTSISMARQHAILRHCASRSGNAISSGSPDDSAGLPAP